MKLRLGIIAMLLLTITAACQSGPPPTLVVMEVTRVVTLVITESGTSGPIPLESTPDAATIDAETTVAETTETVSPDSTAVASPTATINATITPEVTSTTLPEGFPAPTTGQVFVAEQTFENGRMFWIRPINQIWVIAADEEGVLSWSIFEDQFIEGMPESDPTFTPRNPDQYQPIRGFGLLWRDNVEVREALGWAISEEVGYLANYQYHYNGTIDADGTFVQEPGYHIIETLSLDVFRFNEGIWTWEVIEGNP